MTALLWARYVVLAMLLLVAVLLAWSAAGARE